MVRPTARGENDVARIRALCAKRGLTPVWFPGIEADELTSPDAPPGPEGAPGCWCPHGAAAGLFVLLPRAGGQPAEAAA